MKIIYCILGLYNPGGMERVLLNKVRWICDNTGWEVVVVTTDQRGREPFYRFPEKVRFIDLNVNYTDDNGKGIVGKTTGYLKKRRLHRKRLSSLLKAEKPDITVSLFPCESSFIPAIKDGSKKVLELHFSKNFRVQYGRKGIFGFIDRMRMRQDERLVRKFDSFVVLTHEDAGNWGKLSNLSVIPNAVSQVPQETSRLDFKRVIAVGRLDFQKGFDRLINAWHILLNKYPNLNDWVLEIFGQGEWHGYLTTLIKEKSLESNIRINRPTDNITSEYLSSSILAMTSNYEGFGMVLVEAMSCGLPCVAFDCPCGPSEIITNNEDGILVSNGDTKAFANALASLMLDDEKRKRMGEAARESVARFSESSVMQQWERLFSRLTR